MAALPSNPISQKLDRAGGALPGDAARDLVRRRTESMGANPPISSLSEQRGTWTGENSGYYYKEGEGCTSGDAWSGHQSSNSVFVPGA